MGYRRRRESRYKLLSATLVSSNLFDLFQSELSSRFSLVYFLPFRRSFYLSRRASRNIVKIADVKGHCYLSFIRASVMFKLPEDIVYEKCTSLLFTQQRHECKYLSCRSRHPSSLRVQNVNFAFHVLAKTPRRAKRACKKL